MYMYLTCSQCTCQVYIGFIRVLYREKEVILVLMDKKVPRVRKVVKEIQVHKEPLVMAELLDRLEKEETKETKEILVHL